jgi:two-component system sensor histidine kinase UhpB
LLVEDSPNDAEILMAEVKRAGFAPNWKRVETERDFLAELERLPDIVLSDYSMPGFSGLRALELLRERKRDIPFILISGTMGEDMAVEAMKRGASDYLLKDRLARLGDAVKRSLDAAREAAERRELEIRYRRLFETAQDGILILDAGNGQITDVNPYLVEMLGFSRDEIIGKTVADISPDKDIESNRAMLERLRKSRYVRYDNLPLETKAGHHLAVEFVCNVYQAGGGDVIQCNVRDMAERKQAEEKREQLNNKLQVLSRQLVEAQESERRFIARELHDEIGQSLTVAQLNLQATLQSPVINGLAPRLKESLDAINQVLQQVQDISLNLRPTILDDLGLEPALKWLARRQASSAGLRARTQVEPLPYRLDPVVETECFRVAQEALTNVIRHAHATAVAIKLREENGWLHLRVRDNGKGFDVTAVWKQAMGGSSLGLLSMEERAILAGGGLEYKSAPGKGAEIHAWFPLKWRAPEMHA